MCSENIDISFKMIVQYLNCLTPATNISPTISICTSLPNTAFRVEASVEITRSLSQVHGGLVEPLSQKLMPPYEPLGSLLAVATLRLHFGINVGQRHLMLCRGSGSRRNTVTPRTSKWISAGYFKSHPVIFKPTAANRVRHTSASPHRSRPLRLVGGHHDGRCAGCHLI